MLKKKTLIICIFVILILLLMIILYILKNNKQDDNYDWLKKLENVSYIELSYGRKEKELNNQLSELLNNIYNNSKDELKIYISNHDDRTTGQQPYLFVFYSKNGEVLYRLQFYDGKDEMILYPERDPESDEPIKVNMYTTNNEDVLKYVKGEVEKFNNELYNEDV